MTRKRWRLVTDDESGDVFSAAVGVPVEDAVPRAEWFRRLAADLAYVEKYIDTDEDYPNRCLGGVVSLLEELASGTWKRMEDHS